MRAAFITWANDAPTGGNVYNAELVMASRPLGLRWDLHVVPGSWPPGSDQDHQRLTEILLAEPLSLVDGIVASGAPESITAAVAAGRVVAVLVHLPIVDEVGLPRDRRAEFAAAEAIALRAASGVICPSAWAAARVRELYGLNRIGVAVPGVHPAGLAAGSARSGVPRLLCVASVTPTKNQLTLVRALDAVGDLAWTARLVGSEAADPVYAALVRAELMSLGLTERVRLTGALTGEVLNRHWDAADLLLLPSRVDMYPLVVGEALARGIPAIVGAGTGAVEALQSGTWVVTALTSETAAVEEQSDEGWPGRAVDTGGPGELASTLRDWLTDPALRKKWREAALVRRQRLPGWGRTAVEVVRYLRGLAGGPLEETHTTNRSPSSAAP